MKAKSPSVYRPKTIAEVRSMVRKAVCILPRGGGTKPSLSTPREGMEVIEMGGLSGVLEYQPGEYTFTALAGTPLAQVNQVLADHHQYLPFDPLLVERGATLGGTVAANTSGSGRYHYGGVRDFLIGVRFVNSDGQLVRGGGKVVKNAAGFDLPKLMVGSLGSFGVLVELSFKVFPRPEAYATLCLDYSSVEEAVQAIQRVAASHLDVDALDIEVSLPGEDRRAYRLWVRIGGLESALGARLERLQSLFGETGGEDSQPHNAGPAQLPGRAILRGVEEEQAWRNARELTWVPQGWSLVKTPLTPGRIARLESALGNLPVLRRYACGGQIAWLALEGPPKDLEGLLVSSGLTGVALFGQAGSPRLAGDPQRPFYRRVKDALDPAHHFVEA